MFQYCSTVFADTICGEMGGFQDFRHTVRVAHAEFWSMRLRLSVTCLGYIRAWSLGLVCGFAGVAGEVDCASTANSLGSAGKPKS